MIDPWNVALGPSADDETRWRAEAKARAEKQMDEALSHKRKKAIYVGAPACFHLELACQELTRAFGDTCYLVGSALERPDWRDVDVRMIMEDADFDALFPGCRERGTWEFNPRWLVMTTAIAAWLRDRTGLPIDFQFQPRTHANERHQGRRNALVLIFSTGTGEPA